MKNYYKVILFLAILIWVILAGVRTLYNLTKLSSEIKIFGYSEIDKKKNAYGSVFDLSEFIKSQTSTNARIIFYTTNTDSKDFYLSRYLIYPRLLFLTSNIAQINQLISSGKYSYILSYNKDFYRYKVIKQYNNTVKLYILP